MSTYSTYGTNSRSGYSYQEEARRRQQERESAPKTCPHCGTPINEHLGTWDKPRYHCGADACRAAAYRRRKADKLQQARTNARERVYKFCEQYLDGNQRRAVMEMCDLLLNYDLHNGHKIALEVIQVIDAKRCKHDRIGQLEEFAALTERRREATERQLKARIEELEAELALFNTLHATIHNIAQDQQRKQPDPPEQPNEPEPEPEEEDPDRAEVLATLRQAGIKPIEEALAEQDDPEREEYDEEDEDE